MKAPLISICIPTYNQPQFLNRCLNSVTNQDYDNVEVIVSDDSPCKDIKEVIALFQNKLLIKYFSNKPALKSPQNWNNSLDKASGDLLLLLHQDDWLHTSDALSSYAAAFEDPTVSIVFSRNTAVNEQGSIITLQNKKKLVKQLNQKPSHLLLSQVVGPPSNLMLRNNISHRFDKRFIWLVDVDFYIRLFGAGLKYKYLDRHLVSIGLHNDQTTVYCQNHPEIIFKENILLAEKLGAAPFSDLRFFDYFWRLLRNHNIREEKDFLNYGFEENLIPSVLRTMVSLQKKIPLRLLLTGIISKLFMFFCYTRWKFASITQKTVTKDPVQN